MALSYLSEGEAPRDFKVSSTDSDGHYTKCPLCYTVKRNFYCEDCIKNGDFLHSSMPYSDRYSEKQAKLLRVKVNKKHVLDRCERLLANKVKKDQLLSDGKQSRDKIDLLRLAIEQRRSNIEEKRKELNILKQQNLELTLKMPRYQKRVLLLGKHAQDQHAELQKKMAKFSEQADKLAALRRSRIRQLTNYIFPVYISYDTSDSIEDMEFVGDDAEEEFPKRPQLHIVNSWINIDGDFSHVQAWLAQMKEPLPSGGLAPSAHRVPAALALAAQLAALLAWALDLRLPCALTLSEFCNWRVSSNGAHARWARLQAACAALARRTCLSPAPGLAQGLAPGLAPGPAPLAALHDAARAASSDDPALGRVEAWAVAEAWSAGPEPELLTWASPQELDDPEPPEHLSWPDHLEPETPRAPAASLVTSAAASLASLLRWGK